MKGILCAVFLIPVLLLQPVPVIAGFNWMEVGVNGLTCSQCSRSVEMSLRRLPFVKEVQMNLEQTQAHIELKEGISVDVRSIARAVEEAGFSVRFIRAEVNFSVVKWQGRCFEMDGFLFQLIGKNSPEQGMAVLKFEGKSLVPDKEWNRYKRTLRNECGETENPVIFAQLE